MSLLRGRLFPGMLATPLSPVHVLCPFYLTSVFFILSVLVSWVSVLAWFFGRRGWSTARAAARYPTETPTCGRCTGRSSPTSAATVPYPFTTQTHWNATSGGTACVGGRRGSARRGKRRWSSRRRPRSSSILMEGVWAAWHKRCGRAASRHRGSGGLLRWDTHSGPVNATHLQPRGPPPRRPSGGLLKQPTAAGPSLGEGRAEPPGWGRRRRRRQTG